MNLGKLTATTAKCRRSSAITAGSSWLSSQTPSRPTRSTRSSRSACHIASGTMMSPANGISGSVPSAAISSRCHESATTFRFLMMIAIYVLLEWLDAGPPHDVDEALAFALTPLEIDLDQLLDHVGNLLARERGPDHLA